MIRWTPAPKTWQCASPRTAPDVVGSRPGLRLVIPHGGGAVPYHWGRFRGLADMLGRPPVDDTRR